MVTVPVVQSQARLQTGPASATINPSAARGIAQDYSGAGDALMRVGANLMAQQDARQEREQRARDAVEALRVNTHVTKTLNDAAFEIEREGDWKTGNDRYAKTIEGLQGMTAGISDPVRKAQADAHIAGLAENHRIQLRQKLFKQEADNAVATLDENLESQAQAAAGARNQDERNRYMSGAAAGIKSMADNGFIDRSKAVNLWQGFKGKISGVEAERVLQGDPYQAERLLSDPKNFPHLDAMKREKMIERANQKIDQHERRLIAQGDKAERQARQQFEDTQRFNEGQVTAMILEGKTLTPAQIGDLARTQKISPSAARTLNELAKSGDDAADNMTVVMDVQRQLYRDGQDISGALLNAVTGKQMSRATALRLQKENEDRKKQNPMNAAQKNDYEFMSRYLGADKLAFSMDDDTAQRVALAQREFNRRVIGGGEPSDVVANDLVARFAQKVTPIPGSITGEVKTRADIGAAAERLQQLRANGLISPEALEREAQRLRDAEAALPPAAAQPAGKGKPASKGKAEVVK